MTSPRPIRALLLGMIAACSTEAGAPTVTGGDTGSVPPDVFHADVLKTDAVVAFDAGDTSPPDVPPLECPGGFGCPCENGTDCNDDYCIQGVDSFICSQTCLSDCPEGFRCLLLFSTCPDCVSLCIPDVSRNCAPCQTDADCLAGRCLDVAGGKACADQCSDASPCPDAFACDLPDDAGETAESRFCRPINDTCDCRAADAGTTRACTIQNGFGICAGVESCDAASGWTGCTAKAPALETCNGQDDDCDGPADDGVPEVGTPCERTVAGVGSCDGAWACAGEAGLVCGAAIPAAETCNELDDDCDGETDEAFKDAAGLLVDDAHCGACGLSCEGKIPFATAICALDEGAPACVVGECDAGLVPVSDTQCADPSDGLCGSCISAADCAVWQTCTAVGAGTFCTLACAADENCPTGFGCKDEHCVRETGGCGVPGQDCTYAWECEDLDACTDETCDNGICASAATPCDDASPCTADSCNAVTGCVHLPAPGGCDDGDACTLLDACQAGDCTGTAKTCNDDLPCTSDSCTSGNCSHAPIPGTCNIGDVCYGAGDLEPGNGCRACVPTENTVAFVEKANGFPCSDDDACSTPDQCQGGACNGGAAVDCNDGNPCTDDLCAFDVGCVYLPNSQPCNDGKFCTVSDACSASTCSGLPRDCGFLTSGCATGVCSETKGTCQTAAKPTGTSCDDLQACTQGDICVGGACKGAGVGGCCATAADCSDGNPCTVDSCEPSTGTCSNDGPAADDSGCNDGRYCTIGDTCEAGVCTGSARDCSAKNGDCVTGACDDTLAVCVSAPKVDGAQCLTDGNACTDDACSSGTCGHVQNTSLCNDGDACTYQDACDHGGCAGVPYTCDDGRACTLDSCDGDGSCTNALASGSCLVGGACYSAQESDPESECRACLPAVSTTAFSPLAVGAECQDDGNPCTSDACAAGLCAHVATTAPCDDGLACTQGDACGAGSCAGSLFSCDDGAFCTADSCDGEGGCDHAVDEGTCFIGGACYLGGTGKPAGPCQYCAPDVSASTWTSDPDGIACDDGSACSETDACQKGGCKGVPIVCDDQNACTDDSCSTATGCANVANTLACSDGKFCTTGDKCASGTCSGGPRDCAGKNDVCNTGTCDEATEQCIKKPVPNATACNDGQTCTGNDACSGGVCSGVIQGGCCTTNADCEDQNPCTTNTCVLATGNCVAANVSDGTACQDGFYCTTGDTCSLGLCGGGSRDCSGVKDACNSGVCDEVTDACTKSALADGALCPDDGNPCTNDSCSGGGCAHPNNTTVCNDGTLCTKNDACSGGTCKGAAYSCDDGLACTTDTCNGLGGCGNAVQGSSCVIGGQCVADGAKNPANPCLVCAAGTSTTSWSSAAAGTPCDDGNACTKTDVCATGVCGGTAYDCADGLACTADDCNGLGGCTHPVAATSCLIGGACVGSGSGNPGNACQECNPVLSQTTWVSRTDGVACTDGNSCTKSDACQSGACSGQTYTCGDAKTCTNDLCDGLGGCQYPVTAGACLIDGTCRSAGELRSGSPCEACDPSKTSTGWSSVANGTGCDDGQPCTKSDVCAAGLCKGTPYSCADPLPCTNDVCDGSGGCGHPPQAGSCVIDGQCVTEGTKNPQNGCQACRAQVSTTSWSNVVDGATCSDGQACTKSDTCTAGACGGTAYDCADPLGCTTDICDGAGGCTHPLQTGTCLISNTCWTGGTTEPGNACRSCQPSTSTGGWTNVASGTSCNDLKYCTVSDQCTNGTCGGADRDCQGSGDQCNTGTCNEGLDTCQAVPKQTGTGCSDGKSCTGPDTCGGGVCAGPTLPSCCTSAADCNDNNACTKDTCTVATGTCTNDPAPQQGAVCDDGLFCTINDACAQGLCAGAGRSCASSADACNSGVCSEANDACEKLPANEGGACAADTNVCTNDLCLAGTCVHPANLAACNDGNPCTTGDQCGSGTCQGTAYNCPDTFTCTQDLCDGLGGCTHPGVANGTPCTDGNACTSGDACQAGQCSVTPYVCSDGNSCTDDVCNGLGGCTYPAKPVGTLCDDLTACTTTSACAAGSVCTGAINKDADNDQAIDGACAGGTDCDDTDATRKPGVADPIEGVGRTLSRIDEGGVRGEHVAADQDALGHQHVAFSNPTVDNLEYATDRYGIWMTATIDATGTVGTYAAIDSIGDGEVHIAYYDDTNNDLKYATNRSGTFTRETVTGDTLNDCGQYAAVAATDSGATVHVLYRDATADDLLYRSRTGGVWSGITTVDGLNDTGEYISLKADAAGKLYAAYHSVTGRDAKYATNASGAWNTEVIATANDVGRESRLALSPDGTPNVFYRDLTANRVIHARRPGSGWVTQAAFLGNSADAPIGNRWDVAIDSTGRVHACSVAAITTDVTTYDVRRLTTFAAAPSSDADYGVESVATGLATAPWCAMATGTAGTKLFWSSPTTFDLQESTTSFATVGNEIIDGDGDVGGNASAARGNDGTLYVAYRDATNTALRLARRTAAGLWETQLVDNAASVGEYPDIAIDGTGALHISYYDATNTALKYVKGAWGAMGAAETPDNLAAVGKYTSIVVSPAGVPTIAYFDDSNNDLKVVTKPAATWSIETVDATNAVGEYPAMAHASNGDIHLAYRYSTGLDLRYRRGKPGAWGAAQDIATTGQPGQYNSIALDPSGNPAIATYKTDSADLHVYRSSSKGDAGTWTPEILATTGTVGRWPSIGFDAAGTTYVSFDDAATLRVGQKPAGGTWSFELADGAAVSDTSLVVEPSGAWHVAYKSTTTDDLRHAAHEVPAWGAVGTVVGYSTTPQYTAVAIDAGTLHVAYSEAALDDLRYATSRQGVFFHGVLDQTGSVGTYPALQIRNGVVHIAYYDATNTALKYGRLTNGVWTSETVDNTSSTGSHASLALGPTGTAHIAYYDASGDNLVEAFGGPGAWTREVRDATGTTGTWTSIAVDTNGYRHISYGYESSHDLRYITNKAGGVWGVYQEPAVANDVGNYTSLAVDAQGFAHIADKDETNNDIYYFTNKSGGWVGTKFDSTNDVGAFAALSLNAAGSCYIGYKDSTYDDVKLATNVSGTFQLFDLDTSGDVGQYVDSALDSASGQVWVTYIDNSAADLKVALVTIQNAVDQNCDGY